MTGWATIPPRCSLTPALAAGAMTVLSSGICWSTVGANLGLLIASLVLATLIVQPLVGSLPLHGALPERTMPRLLVLATAIAGAGAIWLPAFTGMLGAFVVLRMLLVLSAYLFATSGIALVLLRVGVHSVLAAAVAVVLALAWLSWPIWLSAHLSSGRMVAVLVSAHPIFALNGASDLLGAWTQEHLMYRLTALGQDVPFTLPRSVLPCALTHLAIGAATWFASGGPARK